MRLKCCMLFKYFHTVCYYLAFTACTYKDKQKSDKKLISDMDIVYPCTAVVRGYHDYKQFWKLAENEEPRHLHEQWQFCCQNSKQEREDCWLITTIAFWMEWFQRMSSYLHVITDGHSWLLSMSSTLKNA